MRKAPTFLLVVLVLILCLVSIGIGQPPSADVVLMNGRVFTSDSARPFVEALAIRGDRVTAVGTSAEIASMAGPQTTRLDLGGRVVIPGINDAHYHLRIDPPFVPAPLKSRDPGWDEVKAAIAAAIEILSWRLRHDAFKKAGAV